MNITIIKWKKFHTKTDFKTPFWFKVSIDIPISESLFGLDLSTKFIWVCLLAEAMRHKSDTFDINIDRLAILWETSKKHILEAIEIFKQREILRVNSESTPSRLRVDSVPEEIRRDKKREEKIYVGAERISAQADVPSVDAANPISQKLLDSWIKAYGDYAWIDQEINKAKAWIEANPQRAPRKNLGRFLNNWLSRGWENYRKTRLLSQIPKKEPFKYPGPPILLPPSSGPMPTEIKSLLDKALGRNST